MYARPCERHGVSKTLAAEVSISRGYTGLQGIKTFLTEQGQSTLRQPGFAKSKNKSGLPLAFLFLRGAGAGFCSTAVTA